MPFECLPDKSAKHDPKRIDELSREAQALQTYSPLIYKSYANEVQDYLSKQKSGTSAAHDAPSGTTAAASFAQHIHDHVNAALALDDLSQKAKAVETNISLTYKSYAIDIENFLTEQKAKESARATREIACWTGSQPYSRLDFEYDKLYGVHLQQNLRESARMPRRIVNIMK